MTNKRRKISAALRRSIYESYGGKCAYCGQPIEYKDMQVDHLVPLYRGGEDSEDNYLPACRTCNYYKHTLTLEDFRREIGKLTFRLRISSFRYLMALHYRGGNSCDRHRHDDE